MQRLLAPREAANILGISYPTLKQWIYHNKLKTVKTPGGHHRVPESEIDRLIPKKLERGDITQRRGNFRKVSGRNQLIGRVVNIKYGGLLAQVTLLIGSSTLRRLSQRCRKRNALESGRTRSGADQSTEVMILRV